MYLFSDSIKRRLKKADKPIFTLSGGLDSSSVVSMACHMTGQMQPAISTIHQDKLYNEQNGNFSSNEISNQLLDFFKDRFKNFLKEKNIRNDIIESSTINYNIDNIY